MLAQTSKQTGLTNMQNEITQTTGAHRTMLRGRDKPIRIEFETQITSKIIYLFVLLKLHLRTLRNRLENANILLTKYKITAASLSYFTSTTSTNAWTNHKLLVIFNMFMLPHTTPVLFMFLC